MGLPTSFTLTVKDNGLQVEDREDGEGFRVQGGGCSDGRMDNWIDR